MLENMMPIPVSRIDEDSAASLLALDRFQHLETAHQRLVDGHHRPGIVELTAIVWGGEDGDQLPLREELVAILNDLMGTADQVHVLLLQERSHHIRTKDV